MTDHGPDIDSETGEAKFTLSGLLNMVDTTCVGDKITISTQRKELEGLSMDELDKLRERIMDVMDGVDGCSDIFDRGYDILNELDHIYAREDQERTDAANAEEMKSGDYVDCEEGRMTDAEAIQEEMEKGDLKSYNLSR